MPREPKTTLRVIHLRRNASLPVTLEQAREAVRRLPCVGPANDEERQEWLQIRLRWRGMQVVAGLPAQ